MKNLHKKLLLLGAALISSYMVHAQTELVTDGSFEAGPGSGAWNESSVQFPSPICNIATCGTGTGTGPNTGNFWAWFGGFAGGIETGTLSQSFVIPSGGTVTLTFWLEQVICDSPQDFLDVKIDGTTVFDTDGASPLCGVLGYSQQTVDISAYADGNSHTLEFTSTTFSANGNETNFFVDDISVISVISAGPVCADTTIFGGLNVAIPDDDSTGVTNSQTITGVTGTLGADVQLSSVCFKIDHTWVGDLVVTLVAPNGTQVVLADRPGFPTNPNGCSGQNIDVCIDKGTGNELENICTASIPSIAGSFTAANGANIAAVNAAGGPANGTWQLIASDNEEFDTGAIIEWALAFDDGPIATWNAPSEICATAGNVNLDAFVTGTTGGTWTGTGVTGSTFNPTGLSGPVSITYTVSDIVSGCSDEQTSIITVIPAAPVASFTQSLISLAAYFINTSTGGTTFSWNFGDMGTSNLENPSHTYAAAGTYTVTLTVTNICGSDSASTSVVIVACPNVVVDGSFESGIGGGSWTETSTNFGTPVCTFDSCGFGGGTGPNSGTFWAWFGGIATFEEGSVSQSFTVALNNTATLWFWLEMSSCDGPDDFLKVAVDADTVYTVNGSSPLCGALGYTLQSVNLNAYVDGLPHTLKFISRVYGTNNGATNFFVDDITLNVCPPIGIAENSLDKNVSVMPVPARDYVKIVFRDFITSNVKIEISDIIGKTVLNKVVSNVYDDQTETIDVSSWNQGVYMVKISAGSGSIVRKIVVE